MKKIAIGILLLMIMAAMPASLLADTETSAAGKQTESESAYNPLTFVIDDTHCYEAMERSYQDGYLPAVQENTAVIILPLRAEGEVEGKTLTVTPELGSTEGSPFVYRNYQKTVKESCQVPGNGGEGQWIYYVRLDLQLADGRYNGVYPVVLNISAKSTEGIASTQSFTAYVSITDGKSTEVETTQAPVVTETKPQSQPIVLLSDYTVTQEPVQAGNEFEIHAVLENTSQKLAVQNMTITVTMESDALILLENSSTIYWDKLGKGESKELVLRFRAEPKAEEGKYRIQLAMSYDNSEAVTLGSSAEMQVNVMQPLRVTGEVPVVASSVNAGDTISLNFQAVNMGRGSVYNVRFELDAPGLIPTGSAYIGNLEGGSAGSAEMKVFVGSKNMNREMEEGQELYGRSSGTMKLIYEDESGQEYSEDFFFQTDIQELVIQASTPVAEADGVNTGQWWIAVGVGAVILMGVSAYLIRRYRMGQKDGER